VNAKILNEIYHNPKTGYVGISELVRKSGLTQNEVKHWLESQRTYTLHKPIRHRFNKRRVKVSKIDDQWQADLVDMQAYKDQGKNYILTIIDIFSKYAWAIPIKKKTSEEVKASFMKVFRERRPMKLQTDLGLEFLNKPTQDLFKKHGIQWFSTQNETKAQVVERFNRTLKTRMWKYFTETKTKNWVDILQDLIHNYNNSYHRSIKMTPHEASLEKNSKKVYNNLFPQTQNNLKKPYFSIGDRVRISKKRKDFHKGYLPNFTNELFIISKILSTEPVTYKLKDMNNEEIVGSFYEQELSKYSSDVYEIEKILRQSKDKVLVKWKGYDNPSWISQADLTLS
jgi:transposase InsO family protein